MKIYAYATAFALFGGLLAFAFYAGGGWTRERDAQNEINDLETIAHEKDRDLTDDDIDDSLRRYAE